MRTTFPAVACAALAATAIASCPATATAVPARAAALAAGPVGGVVTGSGVRVRTRPVDGWVNHLLWPGQRVTVHCRQNARDGWDWYWLAGPHGYGWSRSDMVRAGYQGTGGGGNVLVRVC
ncbi:hypothetical protein [Actinokineospora terrae]|uniref:hypothetical protein n=1 Tax=Actinokineospora terrae TaxID=155974 RepID=UPI000B87B80D|nr:hypothetical protein [Actinokineospora terrae]